MADDELAHLVDPREVVPGYESDLSAVGANRVVDPALIDDTPWDQVHPLTAAALGALPDDPNRLVT